MVAAMINAGANLMLSAIHKAEKIISSTGRLRVYEIGALAVYTKTSPRFLTEFMEDCRIIPCGTYELISQDLTEDEIIKAAIERTND
jgi:hypothetical protein